MVTTFLVRRADARRRRRTCCSLCASGMFLVGLVDDIVHLKPYAKLVGQIIFCTAVTMFGLRLHWLPSPVLDQALTIFWLVGITNAVNLLDNLDGLAGGIAAIAALYLVYFCHVAGAGDGGAAVGDLRRRGRRLSRLQLQPRVDLHGRLRLAVPRLLPRRASRWSPTRRRAPQHRRGALDAGAAAAHPHRRHHAGDAVARAWPAGRCRRAGATTRRTAWSRSACPSARRR